jgi:23S rRNA pseudouridine2605 synthase
VRFSRSEVDEPGKPERLQKVLAKAGLGSRRGCEELILQGRVSVDGQVVRELGLRVDPATARIKVDGEPVLVERIVYFAVNKPRGYVSTNFDPSGRPRVFDLLPEIPERVYTVGRLDEDSTGLMILTNDGELANRLTHPRFGVDKIYRALVAGLPQPETLDRLTEGVWLSEGKVRAKRARIIGRQGQATILELVLAEGKKREIRRMLAKLGHKVMSLKRVAIGPILLKGLPVGECRSLTRSEVHQLRNFVAGGDDSTPRFPEGERPRPGPQHQNRPRPAETPRVRSERTGGPAGPGKRTQDSPPPRRVEPQPQTSGGKPARRDRVVPIRPPASGGSGTRQPREDHRGSRGTGHRPPESASGPSPLQGRSTAAEPPSPPQAGPPRRRIIGLKEQDLGARPLPSSSGPSGRKRPTRKKPRPPRIGLSAKPTQQPSSPDKNPKADDE